MEIGSQQSRSQRGLQRYNRPPVPILASYLVRIETTNPIQRPNDRTDLPLNLANVDRSDKTAITSVVYVVPHYEVRLSRNRLTIITSGRLLLSVFLNLPVDQ